MKPIFRCEYCDTMGIEEDIAKHEVECIHNHTRRSCWTCKHVERKGLRFVCKADQEIPEGKMFEFCKSYEWDEKDHTTRNPTVMNTLFGGLFG
jgi:hypothetical protein